MSDFRLRRKADAAFNTINSFRHLDNENAARNHLGCVAAALARGLLALAPARVPPLLRRLLGRHAVIVPARVIASVKKTGGTA